MQAEWNYCRPGQFSLLWESFGYYTVRVILSVISKLCNEKVDMSKMAPGIYLLRARRKLPKRKIITTPAMSLLRWREHGIWNLLFLCLSSSSSRELNGTRLWKEWTSVKNIPVFPLYTVLLHSVCESSLSCWTWCCSAFLWTLNMVREVYVGDTLTTDGLWFVCLLSNYVTLVKLDLLSQKTWMWKILSQSWP